MDRVRKSERVSRYRGQEFFGEKSRVGFELGSYSMRRRKNVHMSSKKTSMLMTTQHDINVLSSWQYLRHWVYVQDGDYI